MISFVLINLMSDKNLQVLHVEGSFWLVISFVLSSIFYSNKCYNNSRPFIYTGYCSVHDGCLSAIIGEFLHFLYVTESKLNCLLFAIGLGYGYVTCSKFTTKPHSFEIFLNLWHLCTISCGYYSNLCCFNSLL